MLLQLSAAQMQPCIQLLEHLAHGGAVSGSTVLQDPLNRLTHVLSGLLDHPNDTPVVILGSIGVHECQS